MISNNDQLLIMILNLIYKPESAFNEVHIRNTQLYDNNQIRDRLFFAHKMSMISKYTTFFEHHHMPNHIAPDVWQEKLSVMQRLSMDWVLSSSLNCMLHGWSTSARPIRMGRLRNQTSWDTACWRVMIESLMLLVCMPADPLWWMCWFCNEYAPKCWFWFIK